MRNDNELDAQKCLIHIPGFFSVFDYVCGSRTIFVKLLLFFFLQ